MKRTASFGLLLAVVFELGAAFVPPSDADRRAAIGPTEAEAPAFQALLAPDADFPPIGAAGPNDWLTQHPERGQTFAEFRATPTHVPDRERRVIYLLPIGEFRGDARPPLGEIRAYAAAYFQMPVKILPAYRPADDAFEPRQNPHTGVRQILTTKVMAFLRTQLPADGFCLLGVTMTDLYPARSWNYVFGQASLTGRVGIYSFARYDPAFWGLERPANFRDLILRRSTKVLVHETGHMFGLAHCVYFKCVMNGANNPLEMDANPPQLCPVCLHKLHAAIFFDPVQRYADLRNFYLRHGWQPELAWTDRQLAKAGTTNPAAPARAAP